MIEVRVLTSSGRSLWMDTWCFCVDGGAGGSGGLEDRTGKISGTQADWIPRVERTYTSIRATGNQGDALCCC